MEERRVASLRLEQIDSIAGFRAVAGPWDDLWQRSEVTLPTARAELVAQWLEVFAPRAKLRGLLVWEDGASAPRLVAALPLVGRRAKGVLPVGDLASNYWSASGELLLDPAANADAVLDLVAGGLQESPWPLLWLDLVPVATSRWRTLARVLARRGLRVDAHVRYEIGQVEVGRDFAAFEARLSKNLRRSLRKDLRRLEHSVPEKGTGTFCLKGPRPTSGRYPASHQRRLSPSPSVAMRLVREFAPGEVRTRLAEVFELETRSWKNQPGQAVVKTPGMVDFYCRQAEQLAAWGCLRVALLEHGGRPIAGELGWVAKGVYHSFKVAYDAAFAEFGPGHLLRMFLIEEFCRGTDAEVIDFQGPLTEALASWATRRYPIGRLVIAPKRPGSRILLAGYQAAAAVVRRLRGTAGG
jgi:CelD/BcsL family acetyltransferase involved in cellulose biosynthesis